MMTTISDGAFEGGADEYVGLLPARLPRDVLHALSRIDQRQFLGRTVLEWLLYAGAVWLCEAYWHPILYAVTLFWIGGRMHAFGVLMHEATHYRALRSRRLNDLIGEVLLAWPLTVTLHGYRNNHFAHHRELNSERDPDWVRTRTRKYEFPQTRMRLYLEFAKYLVGLNFPGEIAAFLTDRLMNEVPRRLQCGRIAAYMLLICSSIYFSFWKLLLLYWAVPLVTTFFLFMYIRSIAEHFGGMEYDHLLTGSRTVLPLWWEKLFFCPHHINYHIEHHLYPSVPCHNLPALHDVLMRDGVFKGKAHVTRGYLTGAVAECQLDASKGSSPGRVV